METRLLYRSGSPSARLTNLVDILALPCGTLEVSFYQEINEGSTL
jgi:hypothetical protein